MDPKNETSKEDSEQPKKPAVTFSTSEASNMNEWRESHTELLHEWKRQAAVCLWLQIASHYHYARINNWITYPTVVITAATSIGIWGIENSEIGKFIMSGVSLFAGILATVAKHCRAAEKSNEFQLRSKEYLGIIREIDYILALDVDQRPNVAETMLRIRGAFDRIMDLQLDPPLAVIRLYEERFRSLESSMLGSDLVKELESSSRASTESDGDRAVNNRARYTPKTPGSGYGTSTMGISPVGHYVMNGNMDRPSPMMRMLGMKTRSTDVGLTMSASRVFGQLRNTHRIPTSLPTSLPTNNTLSIKVPVTSSQLDLEETRYSGQGRSPNKKPVVDPDPSQSPSQSPSPPPPTTTTSLSNIV